MNSDNHGYPLITADHFFPLASSIDVGGYNLTLLTNAQDYYGTWKLFDGLYNAHFMVKTGIMHAETPVSRDSWDFGTTALQLKN